MRAGEERHPQERLPALVLVVGSMLGLVVSAYYFIYKGVFFSEVAQHFSHRPIGTTIGIVTIGLFVGSCVAGLGIAREPFFAKRVER